MKLLALEIEAPGSEDEDFRPLLKAEARQALETLPLVQAGLIEFQILPLIPYDGFARLFGD